MIQRKDLTDKTKLMSMKVEELRQICKENNISYYENSKRLTKEAMVCRIVSIMDGIIKSEEAADKVVKEEQENTNNIITDAERLERRKRYVENAKVGDIVAFRYPSGKVISAAIVKKSTTGRKFMLETKYGVEHKVSFDDIVWVKSGPRWPKGILDLLKQNKMGVPKYGKGVN